MKKEFIYVKPRSRNAQDLFENSMYKLHSCRVVWRKNGEVGLESINNRHSFTMRESGDDDWEVVK
ncbi:MAG: hypothetical protein CL470_07700 [Acidimicrobiaceae bacterium]|nr:hypothetical protein [Acidimicrobiaceae bacterium]